MDEPIWEALEFEKLAVDDALGAISVEANKEVHSLAEERRRRGEAPAKHETLRVRLEELEKEVRMRVDQRRIFAAQFPQLLDEKHLSDLRKLLEDRIESCCKHLRSLVPGQQPVPSRIDQRSEEAPRLKEVASGLVKQLQLSRKQSREADQPLVFISCGQFSDEERSLGKSVEKVIRELTTFDAYFAENQNSLQALCENIFDSLKRASAFVAIMHHRGKVTMPYGVHTTRGSVWIEQELAIAAFLRFLTGRDIPVFLYLQVGAEGDEIKREGLREQLRLDPIPFASPEDVLRDLQRRIGAGELHPPQAVAPKRAAKDEARHKKAKAVIEKYGEPARIVIRHLQNVEQFRMGNIYDDPLPTGMRGQETREMLSKLLEEGLLAATVQEGRDPSRTFRIAPGMISTLDDLV
jgi:hypothetical protein